MERELNEWRKRYPNGMSLNGQVRTNCPDLVSANEIWGIWKKDKHVLEQIFQFVPPYDRQRY